MNIYLAPLEGITDYNFRNAFMQTYGGVDKVYTPFLSPNSTQKFTTREYKNIDPTINDISYTVPQLLCANSEHFIWAMNEIAPLGYKEINFNLGCPSGTVVAKKKGSGFLFYPEELDAFLTDIYKEAAALGMNISIKTRLGKNDPEEFKEILDIYNKYPISELTIHPRIQSDFYKGQVRMEYFDYAYEHSTNPLVYNGDLLSAADIDRIVKKYPNLSGVMLGRGLISYPWLARDYRSFANTEFDKESFKAFHDMIYKEMQVHMSGDTPVLHHMKEMWTFWKSNYENQDKLFKSLMKCKKLSEYDSIVSTLLCSPH